MSLKIICAPLGYSACEHLCRSLRQQQLGSGVLVLPNRLLQERARQQGLQTLGMDTLANKLLNLNGYVDFQQISRRTQELIVQDIIEYMLERRELQELAGEERPLSYFGALSEKQGFIKAMTSLISQLSASVVPALRDEALTAKALTPEQEVSSLQQGEEEAGLGQQQALSAEAQIFYAFKHWERSGELRLKDQGVLNTFMLYRRYLKNKDWFDLEGKYRLALAVLAKPQVRLPWKQIYFSDFSSFDCLQRELIRRLAQQPQCEVVVGLTYSRAEADAELFTVTRPAFEALDSLPGRVLTALPLEELKQELSGGAAQWRQLGRRVEPVSSSDLHCHCFGSQEQELRWVLSHVKAKLHAGAKADSLAIVVRSLSSYSGLQQLAAEYGVPVSLPKTSPLGAQPLTELLRLALAAAGGGKEAAESYLELLTCPLLRLLSPVDLEQVRSLWQEQCFANRAAAQQAVHRLLPENLELLELLDSFIAKAAAAAPLSERVEQLTQLVQVLNLERVLGSLHKQGQLPLDVAAACLRTQAQVLKLLQQLLEDYRRCEHAADKLTLAAWQELLRDTLSQAVLTLQPGRQDGVLVTEVSNIQGLSFAAVYILGLREGEFPKINNENWIYNDKERQTLNALGVELPVAAQAYAEDRYFFATALAAAHQELYLTWWQEGDEQAASPYLAEVQKLFVSDEGVGAEQLPPSSLPELVCARGASGTVDASWPKELAAAGVLSREQAQELQLDLELGQLDRLRTKEVGAAYNGVLQEAGVRQLVAERLRDRFSASQLEVYAACPFRFLGEKLWKEQLFEPKEEDVDAATEGTLLHNTLAAFMRPHLNAKLTQYESEQLEQELKSAFEQTCAQAVEQGELLETPLWLAEKPRLERLLQNWLRFELQDQQRWTGFVPTAVEWSFKLDSQQAGVELDGGRRVNFYGRIDRLESDGQRFFVTDYKRSQGATSTELKNGLDLQLPLYLLAGAALYAQGQEPLGGSYLVLKDAARHGKLVWGDSGNSGLKKTSTKDELIGSWESFQSFAQRTLEGYLNGIYSGSFAVCPCKTDKRKFCQLKDICRFDLLQADGGESDED